jgi:hypothetical protein
MKISIQRLVIFSGIVVALLSARQLGAADSEVSGVFKGNDQPAKLAFVSARKGTAIAGKDTIKLVFTERDHARDERSDLKALFGRLRQRTGHWNRVGRKGSDLRHRARSAQTETNQFAFVSKDERLQE